MSPFWLLDQSRLRTIFGKKTFRFRVGLLPVLTENTIQVTNGLDSDYFHIISYFTFKTEILVSRNNRIPCS